MATIEFRVKGIEELDRVAEELINTFPANRIFTLSGPMGAGKTTLIQAFCRQLSVVDVVTSPTFSIVNEYLTNNRSSVYHFDLYRLRKAEELMDIGYEDYFYSGDYCFIEWPELAADLIPDESVHLEIKVEETSFERLITVGSFRE